MEWWQGFLIAIGTYAGTKGIDELLAWFREKRNFRMFRRKKAWAELEHLKNEIGWMYQVGSNWKGSELKDADYNKIMRTEDRLLGGYNKYPEIASRGKDVVHWCKIICFAEKDHSLDPVQGKKELAEKYKAFLKACDEHIEKL